MIVGVHGQRYSAVPKNPRDHFRMHPATAHVRCKGVPKIVPSSDCEAKFFCNRSDISLQSVPRIDRCAFPGTEDPLAFPELPHSRYQIRWNRKFPARAFTLD